jgi:hypothetical protein
MSAPLRSTAVVIALWIVPFATGATQEWISHVKTRPLDFEGREILLEGEVVEVRAVSPRSARGLYRLVDASDPSGVLVRTDDLPMTGGPFQVRARIAREFLYEGQLLLDEESRSAAGLPLRWLALAVLGTGVVGLAATGLWLHRIRREEQHLKLGRPMWLIPVEEGPHQVLQRPGTGPVFDYKLHYIEEERSVEFERRRHRLRIVLVACTIVTVVGVGGSIALRVADASRPSFVLLVPEVTSADQPRTAEIAVDQPTAAREDEAIRVSLPPPPTPPRAAPTPQAETLDVAPMQQPTETARRLPIESVVARPLVESVVAPPPPPPVLAAQPLEPARPDPAALLGEMRRTIEAGAERLVQALNGRRVNEVEALILAGGDLQRRDRFLQFVREFQPAATVAGVEDPTLAGGAAEGGFTVSFRWRGDFGVQRQRSARFLGVLRLAGDRWVFEGVRLLEAVP